MTDVPVTIVPPASDSGRATSRPIVEVRGLVRSFGDTCAVRGISFEIPQGEIFGFIGPNGAGKTTTLRILATLLEPTAGEVRIDGACVVNDTEHVRRVVGYMPDYFGVYEGITVEEYLEFFAGAFRISPGSRSAVIRDVMALTDLTSVRERMVSTLSRGMKQRLCLAKTLVHDPKVLLLDEPASALDPRARIELRALLKELGRMGKTILISSHILTELADLCTSVGIIEKGQFVECGNVDLIERRRRTTDRVNITLHESRSDVEAILRGHPEIGDIRVEGDKVGFDYRGLPEDFYKVVKLLTDGQVPLLSVEHETRSLEDLFMELTRGDVQ